MNRGTLLGLLVLFVALGGAAYWQLQRERSGAFEIEVDLFDDAHPPHITAMRIDNLERSVQVRFESRGGEWWIVDPLETRADRGVVERLIEVIERNRALIVPAAEAKIAAASFDPPRAILEVEVQREGGEVEVQRIEVGHRDLDGRSLFVRKDGRILRTLQNLETQIDKGLQEYRTKRIIEFGGETVVEVNRVGKYRPDPDAEPIDLTLMAVREGASWRLLRPYEAALDPLAVSVLVAGTARLPVEGFIEDAAPDVGRYGLIEPTLSVELVTSGGERATVHLSHGGWGGEWLVTREDRRTVWSTAPEDVPALLIPVEAMFDSLILRLARTAIDVVRLETPERALRLERNERGWTVAESPAGSTEFGTARGADARRVDGLLARLEGAELVAFLPDLEFPQDAPPLAVYVEARGHVFGGRLGPETVDAEGEPAHTFQRHGDEVVALVGTWMAELAATPASELLDPRLLSIEEIHLAGLRLESADATQRFVRDDRGRWHREGEEPEAVELLPVLDPLMFLRADEHLEASSSASFLDPLRVVFEHTDGTEIDFTVGLSPGPEGSDRTEVLVNGTRAVLREQKLHGQLVGLLRR